MSYEFNPFTANFDKVGATVAATVDYDDIVTVEIGGEVFVLCSNIGNVITRT